MFGFKQRDTDYRERERTVGNFDDDQAQNLQHTTWHDTAHHEQMQRARHEQEGMGEGLPPRERACQIWGGTNIENF